MIVLIIPDGDEPGFPSLHGPFVTHEEAAEYAYSMGLLADCITSEVSRPVVGEFQ